MPPSLAAEPSRWAPPLILKVNQKIPGEPIFFSELVRLLEENGFRLINQKGSIQYYGKAGWDKLIRVDYYGVKEVPTCTCHAILKAAGIKHP